MDNLNPQMERYVAELNKNTRPDPTSDRMLRWFDWGQIIGEPARTVAFHYNELALTVCQEVGPGPERTVALRKLLESRDAALRAQACPGG